MTECPQLLLTPDVVAAFRYRDLANEGVGLPLAGGLLDQTESFLAAWKIIDHEEYLWTELWQKKQET